MGRRAILLIGTEKTGTTTLQHFLAANRGPLARRGFLYPSFCGAHQPYRPRRLRPRPGETRPPPRRLRRPHRSRHRRDARPASAPRPKPSSPATPPRSSATSIATADSTTPEEIATLRAFLAAFFDDIQIGVYLRRQDQVALSLYSTRLKSGETERRILPRANAEDPLFNYDRSLALWERPSAATNMTVRLFDRQTPHRRQRRRRLRRHLGPRPPRRLHPGRRPERVDPPRARQEFLRRLNPSLEPLAGLPIDEVRGPLAARLAGLFPGRGARPARAEVEAFYAKFRGLQRAPAPALLPRPPDALRRGLLRLSRGRGPPRRHPRRDRRHRRPLHVAAVAKSRRLEAEIAIRDARLHWTRNEPEPAERALRRALRWWPDQRPPTAPSPNTSSASTASTRRSPRHASPAALARKLGIQALPRHPAAPRRRLRRRRRGSVACARSSTPATPPRATSSSRC